LPWKPSSLGWHLAGLEFPSKLHVSSCALT
jgi:hypothetical protein